MTSGSQAQGRPASNVQDVVIGGIICIAIVFTILNRTPAEILKYSSMLAVIFALGIYAWLPGEWIITGLPNFTWRLILALVFLIPILSILGGIIYYTIWVLCKDTFLWLEAVVPLRLFSPILTAVVAVLSGYLLFAFYRGARFFYGLTTVAVGTLVAIQRIPNWEMQPSLWEFEVFLAMFTAGAFLIAHGFHSMHQGLEPDTHDGILRDIKNREARMVSRLRNRANRPPD